jgi:hypothetical protein
MLFNFELVLVKRKSMAILPSPHFTSSQVIDLCESISKTYHPLIERRLEQLSLHLESTGISQFKNSNELIVVTSLLQELKNEILQHQLKESVAVLPTLKKAIVFSSKPSQPCSAIKWKLEGPLLNSNYKQKIIQQRLKQTIKELKGLFTSGQKPHYLITLDQLIKDLLVAIERSYTIKHTILVPGLLCLNKPLN